MEEFNKEIWSFLTGFLTGGVVVNVVKWLADLWAKRSIQKHKHQLDELIESYKVSLKKSEFLFQKEFEAALELSELIRKMLPEYTSEDMDWEEVYGEIAIEFESLEGQLSRFLSRHSVVLDEEVIELINASLAIAGQNKFDVDRENVTAELKRDAKQFYENLELANNILIHKVRSQSRT